MTAQKPNYAFIDSQNVNLGVKRDVYLLDGKLIYKGWNLDLRKFRVHLSEKYGVTIAYLFLGYIKENESMYQSFRNFGYDLIFKEVVKDDSGKPKGNVDAELVLQSAAIDYNNYDKAVIVSGDGDFKCLINYLLPKNKLKILVIPNKYKYSSLLRVFNKHIDFISNKKGLLEYK